jgi:hypothetical protein
VIETKNVKPFSTHDFKNRVKHDRVAANDLAEGEVFENKLNDPTLAAAADELRVAVKNGFLGASAAEIEMSQFISRQMMENKQNLSNDFNGQANIAKVESNATDGLNLQTIDASTEDSNRQKIESSELIENHQLIESTASHVNLQEVSEDVLGIHRETLDPEVRAQNIQEVVGQVNKRLDQFEATNFSFLQIGRAQKFTDDFVLIEEEQSGVNRQLLDTSFSRMGLSVGATRSEGPITSSPEITSATARVGDQALHDEQAASLRTGSSCDNENAFIQAKANIWNQQVGKSRTGLWLYRGDAELITRQFVFPYKQVAVALAAIVFATPIYTRPAQSREMVGPLVMLHERATELPVHQQALDSELAGLPQVR